MNQIVTPPPKDIRKGTEYKIVVQLLSDYVAVNAESNTITAQLADIDKKTSKSANGAVVTPLDSGNSDFRKGTIEVIWSVAETDALTVGTYDIEIDDATDKEKYVVPNVCVKDSVI